MKRFNSVNRYLLTDFEGTMIAIDICARTSMPVKTVTALPGCYVDMKAKSESPVCDLELLDEVSAYPLPDHILNTFVDMANASVHEVLALAYWAHLVKEARVVVMLILTVEVVCVHPLVKIYFRSCQ